MVSPAPVLHVKGTVHSITRREVKALQAAPAQYDDQGRKTRDAIEARDGYVAFDAMVLTEGGGFAMIVMREDALAHLDGELPERGAQIEWPLRSFISWEGRAGRKYPVARFAVFTEMLGQQVAAAKSTPAPRSNLAATG